MELTKVCLLTVLVALSTSHAFNTLTPHDKEVIYNWRALVRAGTHYPARFVSQFILHGKLHLQSSANSTHVKLTDLTYKLYNGIIDNVHEHEAHEVPVSNEVESLQHIFKIVYDSHGHVAGIATQEDDKEFSRNIKRAIATTLQMDLPHKNGHEQPHAFVTQEHSIYGYGDVSYNIIPHKHDELIEVHKMHEMHTPNHLYEHMISNTEPGHCDAHFEEPIMHQSEKKYILVQEEGHLIVKHIETAGAILYYPFEAKSDAQFVYVNQTFDLAEVVPVKQQFQIQSEHFENNLKYHVASESETNVFPDITNGRHVNNYEKLVPAVQQMLKDICQYLQEDHINTEEPNSKQGQLINRVQRVLMQFNKEKLEEVRNTLSNEALVIFYHILPLVGTKASALYIKHLIVDKVVKDEIAEELLQHLPENIVGPTQALLTELEQLIHLDEKFSWGVRKSAILSFAALIHKSVKYTKRVHRNHQSFDTVGVDHSHKTVHEPNYDLEEPYEKYMKEYLDKIHDSEDHKVQMLYLFGIYNMRLHSLIKHLLPYFRSDSIKDQHVRFWSLAAAAPAIIRERNPDTVMETLWPIFSNRDESTEMRTYAYLCIMESMPSHARLRNIFWYMLTEPNDEVYNFHYSYVHSMMKSNDPCRQDFCIKMAQLAKFTYRRGHGLSHVQMSDYRDVQYGFSEAVINYFIHANDTQINMIRLTSQDSHIYHWDTTFYVKLHGFHSNSATPVNIFTELLQVGFQKSRVNKHAHIELAIVKHGSINNLYYFDEQNMHEFTSVLSSLIKQSQPTTKELLHISYYRYHKILIPTDLGIPAMWENLMPAVHHDNLTISTEAVKNVINTHIDNRYVNWIHYRHGLSFYNPISDVWQGINRYHSYDTVWPIHVDITFNAQQSLQISWKKHNNAQLDVAGIRSHVKQMVFVKDDHHRNVLVQSSPHSKEFMVVTNGKQFRNDYTLVDEDNLSTGHKLHMAVYDCGHHITNGTYSHLMNLMEQPYTKHYDTPWSHFWMSFANWQRRILLLPRPGIYGVIIRAEPSHEHSVSNIDLSVRLNKESSNEVKDRNYFYSPENKWNTRLTYAVKNKEQSLKTWDVNAIVDMNPGHTVNNLKMYLTRIIPGQKDYKICVDGVKKWTNKGVSGHLNIAMSQTTDGKCVKDDSVIDVTMTGERSHEQEQEHHFYESCLHTFTDTLQSYYSLQCLAAHTTVRHYTYNVKTTNVPTKFKKILTEWWDRFKGYYISYYNFEDEHNEDIGDHNLKVDVVYPMQTEEVDVHVTTPHHVYKLESIPTHYWKWLGVTPDSTVYSPSFIHAHNIGMVDHCVVHHDHHRLNHHRVHEEVPNDWTLYVGDTEESPEKAVYVKQVAEDQIAVKVVDHGHTLEIVPHGKTHQITLDGQETSDKYQHHESWVYYHVFIHEVHQPVAMMFPQSGLHIEYDGHHVVVVVPKWHTTHHGHCYTDH